MCRRFYVDASSMNRPLRYKSVMKRRISLTNSKRTTAQTFEKHFNSLTVRNTSISI